MRLGFVKTWFSNMFGFVVNNPIDVVLKRMHLVYIAALYVTYEWSERLITKIVAVPIVAENQYAMLGLYVTLYGTLLTTFWKAVNDMRKPHE